MFTLSWMGSTSAQERNGKPFLHGFAILLRGFHKVAPCRFAVSLSVRMMALQEEMLQVFQPSRSTAKTTSMTSSSSAPSGQAKYRGTLTFPTKSVGQLPAVLSNLPEA